MDNINEVIGHGAANLTKKVDVVSDSVMKIVNETATNATNILDMFADGILETMDKAATNLTDTLDEFKEGVLKTLNQTTTNFTQTTSDVGHKVNETVDTANRVLVYVDNTLVAITPTIRLISWFVALCLVVLIILFIAYQTKRLIVAGTSTMTKEKTRRSPPYVIEKGILHIIYWVYLVLAIILTIIVFSLFFTHLVDTSQFTWYAHAYEKMCKSLTMLLDQLNLEILTSLLLSSICLAFIYYRQGRGNLLICIKTIAWITWYVSLELPVRLMLDPLYRGWIYFTLSNRRAVFCAVFYSLLFTAMAIKFTQLLWTHYTESGIVLIGLICVLFHAMAFILYVIGTIFNWTLAHIVGVLFTVHTQDDDNPHNMSIVRRVFIGYQTQYIQ